MIKKFVLIISSSLSNASFLKFAILIIGIFFHASGILQAQDPYYEYLHLTTKDGLASNKVYCGLQDSRGFLWFGTQNGLNRYDGKNFTLISKKQGLQKNQIVSLAEDKEGNIWILYGNNEGTHFSSGEMDIYNPLKGEIMPYEEKITTSQKEFKNIRFLLSDREKNIYFITSDHKIFRLNDGAQINPIHLTADEALDFKTLMTHNTSAIFMNDKFIYTWQKNQLSYFNEDGNKESISTYKKNDSLFLRVETHFKSSETVVDYKNTDLLTYSVLQKIIKPGQNIRFVVNMDPYSASVKLGLGENLYIFKNYKIISLETEGVNKKIQRFNIFYFTDRQHNSWIANIQGLHKLSLRENLFRNQFDKSTIQNQGVLAPQVRSIVADMDGNIWAGGDFGLYYYSQKENKYEHLNYQLFDPNFMKVFSGFNFMKLFKQGNRLNVFGQKIGEINLFDRSTLVGTLKNHITSEKSLVGFWSAFQLSSDRFMLGSTELATYDRVSQLYNTLDFCTDSFPMLGTIYRIIQDKEQNQYWAAGDNGLYLISNDLCIKEYFGMSENLDISHRLPNVDFRDMMIDKDGIIWLTSSSTGLVRWDRNKHEFQIFSMEEGMPSNNMYCLLPDEYGHIWISSDNGLVRFNKTTQRINIYTENDGLLENEFNRIASFKRTDGRLYFGGINGLTSFHPSDFIEDSLDLSIPLHVTDYHQFLSSTNTLTNQTFKFYENQQITLNPGDRFFRIEFSLLDYRKSAKQYKYKIDGFDKEWSYLDDGDLQVSGLPYGKFTLKVAGQSSSGVWSNQELSIPIHVVKPLYLRWWAYLLYGLAFLAFLYFFRRIQIKKALESANSQKLIEIDALKTKLYSNITHEFRTPLTVIMGMANQISEDNKALTEANSEDIVLKADKHTKIENRTGFILRNAKSLLQLINQMLDLSKLEDSKLEMNWETNDILVFLNYIAESFHSFAETKSINLVYHSDIPSLVMDFDRKKIQKVISNLLSNAIKFTPENGMVLFQAKHAEADSIQTNGYLQIKVTNSGSIIPSQHLNHVFDRFYQVDDTLTRKSEGTGIGLALTKELVELMNGQIFVKSNSEEGTVFTLMLPVYNKAFPAKIEVSEMSSVQTSTTSLTSRQRNSEIKIEDVDTPLLLIIEDNADVAEYIRLCVEDGYKILMANNGQQGIDLATEYIPDIIISDVMMPEKDGYQVTQHLKTDERTSHIPIILLTAKTSADSKIEGLQRGADAYLTKPFDKKELQVRISKLLELRKKLQTYYTLEKSSPSSLPTAIEHLKGSIDIQIENTFLNKVHHIFERELSNSDYEIPDLSKELAVSHSQVYRKIKAITGQTVVAYFRNYRLQKAKDLLKNNDMTISEIAYAVGFASPSYFSTKFSEAYGYPPKDKK